MIQHLLRGWVTGKPHRNCGFWTVDGRKPFQLDGRNCDRGAASSIWGPGLRLCVHDIVGCSGLGPGLGHLHFLDPSQHRDWKANIGRIEVTTGQYALPVPPGTGLPFGTVDSIHAQGDDNVGATGEAPNRSRFRFLRNWPIRSSLSVVPNPSRDIGRTPTQKSFWAQRWENIEPAVGALVEDAILLMIFVAVLTVAYLALGMLAGLGYDPGRIAVFETIHYWAYVIVFGMFMLDLVIRVTLHTFRKK